MISRRSSFFNNAYIILHPILHFVRYTDISCCTTVHVGAPGARACMRPAGARATRCIDPRAVGKFRRFAHAVVCDERRGATGQASRRTMTQTGRWHSQNTESFDSRHRCGLLCLFALQLLPCAPFSTVPRHVGGYSSSSSGARK